MDNTLRKMRFLFLIPVWGTVLHIFYIYFKKASDVNFSKKKLYRYMFLIALTFLLGVVVVAFIMRIINHFISIDFFLENYGANVAMVFAGYLIVLPCKMYIKKYIIDETKK